MAAETFAQRSGLFAYSGTDCLRNAYYHNDCRRCIEICPESAFDVVRNKLTLDEARCIACGACLGSCPTEALTLEGFDPNTFTEAFSRREERKVSCKGDSACLGSFDAYHYATMALTHPEGPLCDLAHCAECTLNKGGSVEGYITAQIDRANDLLTRIGFETRVQSVHEAEEAAPQRRMVFKKAVGKLTDAPMISLTAQQRSRRDTALPMKVELLKKALGNVVTTLEQTKITQNDPLFFARAIDFDACTICRDCVQFCPTHALQATPDSHGILFTQGLCIGCGICDQICKPDAFSTLETFDLIEIAYNRTRSLVHYEMVMCHECRCPYPYKGGDPICDRCTAFLAQNKDLFTLARDL